MPKYRVEWDEHHSVVVEADDSDFCGALNTAFNEPTKKHKKEGSVSIDNISIRPRSEHIMLDIPAFDPSDNVAE